MGFQNTIERRYASGKAIPWNEMRRYLERRLISKKVARQKPMVRHRIPEAVDDKTSDTPD